MNNKSNTSIGILIIFMVTLTFVILKLTEVISWSWWWVLSPLWIDAGIAIIAGLAAYVILAIRRRRARKRFDRYL